MSSGLRTKVFEGYIMFLVQRWMAANVLRWNDQTLDFPLWMLARERLSQTSTLWWSRVSEIVFGYYIADSSFVYAMHGSETKFHEGGSSTFILCLTSLQMCFMNAVLRIVWARHRELCDYDVVIKYLVAWI